MESVMLINRQKQTILTFKRSLIDIDIDKTNWSNFDLNPSNSLFWEHGGEIMCWLE